MNLPPYQSHSATSKAAAEEIAPARITLRTRVLNYLRSQGPATDEILQNHLDMGPSTERPRRIELVNLGLVRDSGLVMQTASGRSAVVWEAVPERELSENRNAILKQAELPL